MGQNYSVICAQCSHEFGISKGGGFVFHLLHCDGCGKSKSISFEKIGEPHLRYLKGLPGPYCMATREQHKLLFDWLDKEWFNCSRKFYNEEVQTMRGNSKHPYQNDHLYADKTLGGKLVSCRVLEDETIKALSDHNPLIAQFRL
jgi:hypothetical protein